MSLEPDASTSQRRGGLIGRLVDVRKGEALTLAISCLYFFAVLGAFNILRPIRESLGLSGGADKLPYLFTGTMIVSFLLNPLYSKLTAHHPRRRFIPIVYRIAMACLLFFFLALRYAPQSMELGFGYAYYIWVSVFNLFVVTVFWGFMADVWHLEQAKRLFGFIGVGGTLGAMAGNQIASQLAGRIGSTQLLLISIVLLEVAVRCVNKLVALHKIDAQVPGETSKSLYANPDPWRGAKRIRDLPYLRWICAYTSLYALIGTFLYMQQGALVSKYVPNREARTALFAQVGFLENMATLFIQIFLTGRLIRWFGVTFALVSQPFIAACGWCLLVFALYEAPEFAAQGVQWLGLAPELVVLFAVQISLRTSNFATAKPARESLYTVVDRDVKYDSKSFIDTFVYRVSDGVGAWTYKLLTVIPLQLATIGLVTIPLTLAWVVVGRTLGRKQRALTEELRLRADQATLDGSPPRG